MIIKGERSVANQIKLLAREWNINLDFPWTKKKALEFIIVLSNQA